MFICWSLCLVHHNARWPRLRGNGEDVHFEARSEELLAGLPEGTIPRFAMVVVLPDISSETTRTSEVRTRDSASFVSSKSGAPLGCGSVTLEIGANTLRCPSFFSTKTGIAI